METALQRWELQTTTLMVTYLLGISGRRWDNNIKMDLKYVLKMYMKFKWLAMGSCERSVNIYITWKAGNVLATWPKFSFQRTDCHTAATIASSNSPLFERLKAFSQDPTAVSVYVCARTHTHRVKIHNSHFSHISYAFLMYEWLNYQQNINLHVFTFCLFVCLFVGSCFAGWLVRWMVAWLTGLLRSFIHWLVGCTVDWLGSFFLWLVGCLVRSFVRSLVGWLVVEPSDWPELQKWFYSIKNSSSSSSISSSNSSNSSCRSSCPQRSSCISFVQFSR